MAPSFGLTAPLEYSEVSSKGVKRRKGGLDLRMGLRKSDKNRRNAIETQRTPGGEDKKPGRLMRALTALGGGGDKEKGNTSPVSGR